MNPNLKGLFNLHERINNNRKIQRGIGAEVIMINTSHFLIS